MLRIQPFVWGFLREKLYRIGIYNMWNQISFVWGFLSCRYLIRENLYNGIGINIGFRIPKPTVRWLRLCTSHPRSSMYDLFIFTFYQHWDG